MHLNCIKWRADVFKCFKTNEGRSTPFGKKWGQVFRAFQVQSPRLYPSSDSLLLCAQSFQVIPCISGKPPLKKNPTTFFQFFFFFFFDCSSVSSVHHWGPVCTKSAKITKLIAAQNYKPNKNIIPVWLMRRAWSSLVVKICASGIWLCREEDSWRVWWRTPSTGKAKSWWRTSLGEGKIKTLSQRHDRALKLCWWLRIGQSMKIKT